MPHDTSQQQPIASGFGAQTTAREVIGDRRLDGKTAIVTGGYAGIGVETTRVLAAAGARVIVPARDLAKAKRALGELANVTIAEMDLAVPSTIDAFADQFARPYTGRPDQQRGHHGRAAVARCAAGSNRSSP